MTDTTLDAFLNVRLMIRQPAQGYRAAMDAVFLAAACPARAGESVLDLGLGVGVASLCLGVRVPGVRLTGLEIQQSYADLAQVNARASDIPLDVIVGDAARMPATLRALSFDHVITNPPYFDPGKGLPNPDAGRDTAFRESLSLAQWLDSAIRRIGPKGSLTVIHRTERLAEILAALHGRLGALRITPLQSRPGRPAKRVIIRGKKGSNASMVLDAPFCLHAAPQHGGDFEDLTPAAQSILKDGAALP
jgi:tRNA1(Val) A37 N6-methylase TrmN6